MSPKYQLNSPFKESRAVIQNYFSLKERVTKSERPKFLCVDRGVGESDDDILQRAYETKNAIVSFRH